MIVVLVTVFLYFVDDTSVMSPEVCTNVTSPEVPTNVMSPFISSESVDTSGDLPDQCEKCIFFYVKLEDE